MDLLIENTPGSMKMRDTANDKKLTQELKKVGCELEPSKEESFLRWMGTNARKNLAKCRTRTLLVPCRFPQAVRHLGCWLEVGGGASTMIRQRIIAMRTSFYRYAGFMEIKTCLDQSKKDCLPSSDHTERRFRGVGHVFLPRSSGNSWNLRE